MRQIKECFFFVYSLIRRVIPKNFLKHYKRTPKTENNNKNNSKDDLFDPKLTRQIHEFQWIYPRDKCLLEILRIRESFENDYQVRKRKLEIRRFKRIYESYYSKSHRRVQLVNLWDKCLIHQYEPVEFFESLQKFGDFREKRK
ncbi:hypothetical protein Glove_13g110 [Diversispora epigaea]|uniref:Uncharacterized protein n=1 Tax=Diversispora epigaea TaxID=1348612 RepID=A0A397JMP4_9GLOM|nr:hypothetical protein Glove_13g110 [Diversispora epigaea]